jgi:hypothetical protein
MSEGPTPLARHAPVCDACGHPAPLGVVYSCLVCGDALCALCYVVSRSEDAVGCSRCLPDDEEAT